MARWSTPIADEQAGEVLRWYEGLEEQVRDLMRVVPPHGINLQVWSSKVATVLVEACCLVESILYHFRDDAAKVQRKPIRHGQLNLGNYAELYGKLLHLPDRTAILLTDAPEYRTPFALWTDLLSGYPFDPKKHVPVWWDLYNRSKHRRIGVFTAFTPTMAIDALAGALIVISTVPAFAPALVRHEWLPISGGWSREEFLENYGRWLSQWQCGMQSWTSIVETRLFAVPIGYGHLPPDINDFRPDVHGWASSRLQRWF
jgi:hypothetical protein